MTPHYVNQGGELSWLLDDLVRRVPQVSRAVMLTQDGLAIGAVGIAAGTYAEEVIPASSGSSTAPIAFAVVPGAIVTVRSVTPLPQTP